MVPIVLLSGLGLLATVVFVSFSWIDIAVAGLFHGPETGFLAAGTIVTDVFKALITTIAEVCALFILAGLVLSERWNGRFFLFTSRELRFLFYAMVIGPGLIANALFKSLWGRARPDDIDLFGGPMTFSPAMIVSDQCGGNCSFVSGDVSLAAFLLAFALLTTHHRGVWVRAGIAFTALIAMMRMVAGAHFLSDVIFAMIFTWLTVYAVKLAVIDHEWEPEARLYRGVRAGICFAWRQACAAIVMLGHGAAIAFVWAIEALRTAGAAIARPWWVPAAVSADEVRAARNGGNPRLGRIGPIGSLVWLFFVSRPRNFGMAAPERDQG